MILNDFLEIESVTIMPQRNDAVEGIGSGQILTAELATPLWSVDITSPLTEFDTGRHIRAMMNDLNRPGQSFEVYDPIAQYPRSDPTGAILGASNVQLASVPDSNGKISLKGLPNAYKLSPGDFMQIDFAGRRYFFEASEFVTANGSGVTPVFRTFPVAPVGLTINTVVVLSQPKIRCQIVPGELGYGTADSANWKMSGFQIKAIQKL